MRQAKEAAEEAEKKRLAEIEAKRVADKEHQADVQKAALAVIGRFGGSLDTSDPEQEFIRIKNAEASTAMANGDLVSASNTAADGVSMLITNNSGQEVTCVVAEAIAAGKFGKCLDIFFARFLDDLGW